jgi:hypothetical protein
MYRGAAAGRRGRKSVEQLDLLRAAVVFLHAALEDYLRSVALVYLPRAAPHSLDQVPLAGLSKNNRPEKFLLGELVRFRDCTVKEVVAASISEHLDRRSFAGIDDIAGLLEAMGMDITSVRSSFPQLDDLIKRRHQIVHQADRATSTGRGKHWAAPINPDLVEQWKDAVRQFVVDTLVQVARLETAPQRK